MKLTKLIAIATLTSSFGVSAAFADTKPGDPCERSGDIAQVGGGTGSKVFTCVGDKWAQTNTIGEKQFRVRVEMSDGRVLNFLARAGQVASLRTITEQLYPELGTSSDGRDAPASVPHSTGIAMSVTPTVSQSGDIALRINASISETVSIDEYEFGRVKVRSPEIQTHGLTRTVKLREGKSEVVSLGPLKMKITAVAI